MAESFFASSSSERNSLEVFALIGCSGHSEISFLMKSGPSNQRELLRRVEIEQPLLTRSAGLASPWTQRQFDTADEASIEVILFLTQGRHRFGSPWIRRRLINESVKQYI